MKSSFLAALLFGPALCLSAQSPLTTTFANNNGGGVGGAVYFDLNAAIPLQITGIDVNLNTAASTAGSIDIYTCPSTYVGNEANASAWTLIGTGTVTSNGPGVASTIALASAITIPAGANGYAYVGVGHAFAYTNGTGTNQVYSTNELTLSAGAAGNVAFTGTPFTPRVVNTSITYQAAGSGFASQAPFGTGCYDAPRMVYEKFVGNVTAIDLMNTQQTMIYLPNGQGGNYLILPIGPAYDAATPAATGTNLATQGYTSSSSASWDDASVILTLPTNLFPTGFPYPGGSCTDITVNSNGKIYLGATSDASFATNGSNYAALAPFQGLTGAGLPVLSAFNVDLDPTVGGAIWYESPSPSGGVRITWAGIANWQDPTGPLAVVCDIQLELLPTGEVRFAYGASLGTGGSAANDAIVGFSAGFGQPASTMVDWSALNGYQSGDGSVALQLSASNRPVLGTTINFTTANVPAGAPLGAFLYGLVQFNPGLSLAGIGMPGCFQYGTQDAMIIVPAPGASFSRPFVLPSAPAFSGVRVQAQSAVYAPGSFANAVGAATSNGVELVLGVN